MPEPQNRLLESAADFVIKSVTIRKEGSSVNIAPSVAQLEIFENMDYPYLTGYLYFKDDANVYEIVNFSGVELCDVVLSQPTSSPVDIKKTFVIRSVLDTEKINDLEEAVSLYLIEKISFDGSINRYSKSYSGTPLDIINKIAKEKLNITIDQPTVLPVQKPMKVVIPGMTPLEAINFMMQRMTTEDGLPYYFFSTLNDDNLQIKSLEELLLGEPFNKGSPYRYSRAYAQDQDGNASSNNPFIVEKYSQPSGGSENTMSLQFGGAIAGKFSIMDITTGRNETKHYDISKVMQKLTSKGVIPINAIPQLELNYDGQELQNANSLDIHRAFTANTYDEINNYYQSDSLDQYELDVIRVAIKQIFFKFFINLKLPGLPFLTGSNQSIGKQIEYLHLSNNTEATEERTASEDKVRDRKRSGNYMIAAAHHIFSDTTHTVEVSATRLGVEKA